MIVQELIWGRKFNQEPALGSIPLTFIPLTAATIGYIFAVLVVDYYIATSVYLFVVAIILEKKSIPRLLTRILPVALGIPFLLYPGLFISSWMSGCAAYSFSLKEVKT